jgi:ubiquinone/menaquinone biosynthesis C-methylase UbiE
LIVTEGVYLGQRVVTWLYDLTPGYYDRIKEITWQHDAETLAEPMLQWLDGVGQPFVLDVGTGTGRFPKAMLNHARFDGEVWGLDISTGMLSKAQHRLAEFVDAKGANNCTLFLGDADALPFGDEYFDAVVCLETLEFTSNPERTIDELMRVLGPDGVLLITNRIGRASWFPGRTYDDDKLIDLLSRHPISRLEIHSWNSFYDQVWVRKADID